MMITKTIRNCKNDKYCIGPPFYIFHFPIASRVIMGIAVATAAAVILLLVAVVCLMAYRNKHKRNSNNSEDGLSLSASSLDLNSVRQNHESAPPTSSGFNSAPRREEYAWAFSNNGVDVTGDEGIEVDLDPMSENRMKHLAATFNAVGPYQVCDKGVR